MAAAFESFYYRAATGQFPCLSSRQQLWALLITITDRKVVNNIRRQMARKRGGGRVRGESTFDNGGSSDADSLLACVGDPGPSPDVAASLSEMYESLDEDMQQIIGLKMDGYTSEEIAQRLNRSLATIDGGSVYCVTSGWRSCSDESTTT